MRSLLILPLLLGFSFPANAKSESCYVNVSAESIDNFILSGKYKNGYVSGNDSTVTVNIWDTVIFNVDAFSHPF